MPVDVVVAVGMRAGSDVGGAYRLRERLARDAEAAKIDSARLMRARVVGEFELVFEPLVAGERFQALHTRDAVVAAGVLAASLLGQGYEVRAHDPAVGLVVTELPSVTPQPGQALVSVVAPLGL